MRAVLQVGDALATLAEAAMLGGRSVLGMQEAAVVLEMGADVLDHQPLDRSELTVAVMVLGGMHGLEPGAPAGPDAA
ncbi:hypothetical protein, partial [Stenotrophomonas sp. SrG]|uniref:hypothetical protein n=1 Tax=Stenotrophomonas sp. SrG TaxID=3414430 RepID=UPI003CEDCAB9